MIKKERLRYRNGRAVFLFSVCESMSLWRQKQGIAVYFLHSGNNFIYLKVEIRRKVRYDNNNYPHQCVKILQHRGNRRSE